MPELYKEITAETPGRFLTVTAKSEKFKGERTFLYFLGSETVSKFCADSPGVPYSSGHWKEITPTDDERALELAASFGDSLTSFNSVNFSTAVELFVKAPASNRQGHESPRTGYCYVIAFTLNP